MQDDFENLKKSRSMARVLLITGWGGGTGVLTPLQNSLQQLGHEVELLNIFNVFDPEILQQQIDYALTFDILMGWSLGGELAIVLADEVFKHTGQTLPLVTLATNPSFVARENWSTAMPETTFSAFKQGFQNDPASTLKRFGLLVTKGTLTAKSDWTAMQTLLKSQPLSLLRQGLMMLEQLNLVEIVKNYKGAQLHIFAEYDALVPYQVVQNMHQIATKETKIIELANAAHSFPFTKLIETSGEIEKFIHSSV